MLPPASEPVDARRVVEGYFQYGYRVVFWSGHGDAKGPREKDWTTKVTSPADYTDGDRVGLLLGTEVQPGKYLYDVDIDWAPGQHLAQVFLPQTGFVFGHGTKRISHCFYLSADLLPTVRYEDVDKTCLIELRGAKADLTPGMQTMVPPSVWSKNGLREPLTFVRQSEPQFVEADVLKGRVALAAVGMMLAKHFGTHGFGHEARLAWSGFLLRLGVAPEDLVTMGEAISLYCDNREIGDVRTVVESTVRALNPVMGGHPKKVVGGPALEKLVGKQTVALIRKWLGHDDDFVRLEGKVVANHQGNIRHALSVLGVSIHYNEFADKLLMEQNGSRLPLEDRELNTLWLRIDQELHFRPSFVFFEKVVKDTGWAHPFHPVKDYLAPLVWDGVPRIDTWLIRAAQAEDSPYTRAISAIVLIAGVRRIRQPGCKYDELMVIESGQGLNKSSALRALCPDPEWFSDDLPLNVRAQQMIEGTLGKWIIEASELSGMRTSLIEHLKSTLSRQVDGPARLAYAHMAVERRRQFILIGSTNGASYLADHTGGRRFWPVKASRFDVAWIQQFRDQLWAEAAAREAKGDSIRLHESLWPDAEVQQERRRDVDPWESAIYQLLQDVDPSAHSDGITRVFTNDIWDKLSIPTDKRDRRGSLRISDIMQRFGFLRVKIREGQSVNWGFRSLEADWHAVVAPTFEVDADEPGERIRTPGDDDEVVTPRTRPHKEGKPPF